MLACLREARALPTTVTHGQESRVRPTGVDVQSVHHPRLECQRHDVVGLWSILTRLTTRYAPLSRRLHAKRVRYDLDSRFELRGRFAWLREAQRTVDGPVPQLYLLPAEK